MSRDSMNNSDAHGPKAPSAATQPIAPRRLLLIAAVATSVTAGVLHLGGETREDGVSSFDRAILLALRVPGHLNTPIGPPELKMIALDFTALGGWTVLTLVIFLVAGYLAVLGERRLALLAMIGTSSGALLSETLKTLFTRPRPELVVHLVPVSSYSYPSGHAMNAAIVYLTLAAIALPAAPSRFARAYLVTAALLLVGAIGLTRLYLGVHWPTDVLAGWAAGTGWAYFWAQLLKAWPNRVVRG